MFPALLSTRTAKRIVFAIVAMTLLGSASVAQEPSTVQKKVSRFPVVVLERDDNFSIPNAAAEPAASKIAVTASPFLPKEIYQRTAQPILDATELISEGFDRSVVEISADQNQIALGTVVSLKGHVLTKYSLVRDVAENQIRFRTGELSWSGTLVGFDNTNDVALFAIHSGTERPETALRPITFTTSGRLRNGKIVIGIGTGSESLAVGMTTAPSTFRESRNVCETCIDMGLSLDAGLQLTRVYPRTIGERLGLLVGDRVLMVNQQRISTVAQFEGIEKDIQVGDIISVAYKRNGQAFVITDKVPAITKNSKSDRWGGGPFSQRRNGFSEVLVHDSVIAPTDCGGPLVNLQGQFCGINIARSMRVASLAIPAESLQTFLLRYLSEADLIVER